MTMTSWKRALLALAVASGWDSVLCAQHQDVVRPAQWNDLVFGGRFMDRFEPIPLLGPRTSGTWGVDAVKPRDVLNGIEDPEWSYWGGNILEADDGTYHLFVCRWREDHPKGHMAWPQSEVVRAISRNRLGPYRVAQVIGAGHNPEVYKLGDGRYVCYVIDGYYLGATLAGPWERKAFEFDPRDRKIIEGLSNLSFTQREDGSFLMVDRGGGMWVSRDGLAVWEQVTQGSNYPRVAGRFEDPVLWRTEVQYQMIVNDWYGRIAYHLRSPDGVHWQVDPGEAYMPGIALSEDGKKDEWYKYERIKVFLDDHRRAVQANFAVIDFSKWEDLPHDVHSSKNISIPMTPDRLITLLNDDRVGADTGEVRVRVAAEADFDPHQDIQPDSLRFGSPAEVDYGRGAVPLRTQRDRNDLIVVFPGDACGFKDLDFAGKLLGRTSQGKLLIGFCRLPWVPYNEPIVSARRPEAINHDGRLALRIEVSNHGQVESRPSDLEVASPNMPVLSAACPALEPYGKATVEVPLPLTYEAGKSYDLTITTGLNQWQPMVYTAEAVGLP